MILRIAGLAKESYVDGPGIRCTVFLQGCQRHCPGCHNPSTHDPAGGAAVAVESLGRDILSLRGLDGVTLSGGEPFLQPVAAAALAAQLKAAGLHLIGYTGFLFEELFGGGEAADRLLGELDVLVDGPFITAERDPALAFRGSRNQRVIDVPASLSAGRVTLVKEGW